MKPVYFILLFLGIGSFSFGQNPWVMMEWWMTMQPGPPILSTEINRTPFTSPENMPSLINYF
jgi:hypothetical protein